MENVDWAALPFNYHKTDYNVRNSYKDGKWGEPELTQDEYISVHMSAPCLHYGVESFEGLKAFRGADGKVRLFRPDENGKRFAATARKLCMAELPVEPSSRCAAWWSRPTSGSYLPTGRVRRSIFDPWRSAWVLSWAYTLPKSS